MKGVPPKESYLSAPLPTPLKKSSSPPKKPQETVLDATWKATGTRNQGRDRPMALQLVEAAPLDPGDFGMGPSFGMGSGLGGVVSPKYSSKSLLA